MKSGGGGDRAKILSVVMAVLCMAVIGWAAKTQQSTAEFTLGDFSGTSVAEAEQEFASSGATEELLHLLKVLCFHRVVGEDASVEEKIARYGTMLYDRARSGEVDLSKLGSDEVMTELLGLIRSFGAQ